MLDTLIRGGFIVDGSGSPGQSGDIGIRNGTIVSVGERITAPAREIIDADGALVTPGFIDIHTHYDGQVFWDDKLDSSFSNGVTTIIAGNCGVGFAPLRQEYRRELIEMMEGVEDIPGLVLAEGLDWQWRSFADYLDRIAERGQQLGRLLGSGPEQDHGFAAAHRQAGHGVLVAHAAAQAQRVAHGIVGLRIMPEARTAGARSEMGGVDGDDAGQPRCAVMHQLHELVLVKIRIGPECHRARLYNYLIRRHNVGKMGRMTGSEPATSGTTNRRSNQLSYIRHKPVPRARS